MIALRKLLPWLRDVVVDQSAYLSTHRSTYLHNNRDLGNDRIMMEITPWQQDVGATSNAHYTGGKLDFRVGR